MAKVRLDELEREKLDQDGESIAQQSARAVADRMVLEAKAVVTKVQPSSPYAKLNRDQLLGEAARLDVRVGSLLPEEDLRIVLEHARLKLTGMTAVKPADPAPPVPASPVKPVRIRGLKPSPTNTWVVRCPGDKPRQVSVGGGQMTWFRNGKRVELRHYGEVVLQSLVDQGVKLVPIEEPEPED